MLPTHPHHHHHNSNNEGNKIRRRHANTSHPCLESTLNISTVSVESLAWRLGYRLPNKLAAKRSLQSLQHRCIHHQSTKWDSESAAWAEKLVACAEIAPAATCTRVFLCNMAGTKSQQKKYSIWFVLDKARRWSCSHSVQPACTNHTTLPSSGHAPTIQIINFGKNMVSESARQYHIRYSVLHCMRSMWVLPLASGSLQSVHKLQLQFHLAMQKALKALEALLMH